MGSLESLPQDCLSLILSWTSPLDVCTLAAVSRFFAQAARSNVTWQNLLPSDYAHILRCSKPLCLHPARPSDGQDKRKVFQWLTHGTLLLSDSQAYLLLKRSAGVCRFLSVSAMDVAWGNDRRFWHWESSRRSIFPKVAHLVAVCWLEVKGKWNCSLPPGKYSVCWFLKVINPQGGQGHFLTWLRPLRFFISHLGNVLEKELDLLRLPHNGYEKWFEFEVGQIDVKGIGRNVVDFDLEFGIQEIDCSFWKGGLFFDCLTVRPCFSTDVMYSIHLNKHLGKIHRRTGVF